MRGGTINNVIFSYTWIRFLQLHHVALSFKLKVTS